MLKSTKESQQHSIINVLTWSWESQERNIINVLTSTAKTSAMRPCRAEKPLVFELFFQWHGLQSPPWNCFQSEFLPVRSLQMFRFASHEDNRNSVSKFLQYGYPFCHRFPSLPHSRAMDQIERKDQVAIERIEAADVSCVNASWATQQHCNIRVLKQNRTFFSSKGAIGPQVGGLHCRSEWPKIQLCLIARFEFWMWPLDSEWDRCTGPRMSIGIV